MPELPEVEAARSAIAEHCIGKTIINSIIANDSKVINGVSPSLFQASILNKKIVAAHRKGKNMWLQLDSPPFPSFQFGMAGAVYIKGVAVTKYKRSAVKDTDEWPSKYSMFFVELNDGLEISFTDKRRFATVRLLDDPTAVPPISELGPDAFLEPMTEVEFFNSLNKKKIAIKALLLDQSFISGIGNWIADEVLYQAKIHPSRGASSLSQDESARLLKCIKEVLEKAVEVGADSTQYPCNWIYHSRDMKPGKAFVDGKKIDFIKVGGRTTAYVPELQKLNGEQPTKVLANPRKQASKKKKNDDHANENDDSNDDDSDGDDDDGKEDERESAKPEPAKNNKNGKQPAKRKKSTKNDESDGDDDKSVKKRTGIEESNVSNKIKKSRDRRKKATIEAKSQNNDDDDGSEEEGQKIATKAKPQKPQKQTKKKTK